MVSVDGTNLRQIFQKIPSDALIYGITVIVPVEFFLARMSAIVA